MRILVLGDIHGRSVWKSILDSEKYDKVIFLGDYVDSFDVTNADMLSNLKDLIKFREDNDNCVLCYGNHEHSYVYDERCSGWSGVKSILFKDILSDAVKRNLIVPVHIEDNIIFSHAGVSKTWMNLVGLKNPNDINWSNLKPWEFDFNTIAGNNRYGDTISQSPIWIRPKSLLIDKIDGFKQVVGHTEVTSITEYDDVIIADALPRQYLIIENGVTFLKNVI